MQIIISIFGSGGPGRMLVCFCGFDSFYRTLCELYEALVFNTEKPQILKKNYFYMIVNIHKGKLLISEVLMTFYGLWG